MIYKEDRPWGSFEVLYEEEGMKVKRITVKPGKRLSLQSHNKRSENWLVIAGSAIVTLDNKTIYLLENQTVFIPKEAKHRVECNSQEDLVFVEVQRGDYLGEDDIVRYQDDFDRA